MKVNRIAMEMVMSGLLNQPGTSDLWHTRTNTTTYRKKNLKYFMRYYAHIVFILQEKNFSQRCNILEDSCCNYTVCSRDMKQKCLNWKYTHYLISVAEHRMLIFNNFPLGQEEQPLQVTLVLKNSCMYSWPTGYVKHQQVQHSTTVDSPHTCIYVFCIYLRTNSDLCHLQHKLIGFYNRDEKCLLRGTEWVFK